MLNNTLFLREKRPTTQIILVVEDDLTIGGLLMDIINEETSYKALLVPDGQQALQLCRSLKPDLFLLDYQLPYMNGLDLYDTLHAMKNFAEIPALFMSAEAPVSELEKRHVCFISKPFELEDMLNAIERHLGSFQPTACRPGCLPTSTSPTPITSFASSSL